jgi:NAD(P)-dependent dehydrogenase (short-subunit alcohol dehydrogenase family)
VADDEIDRTIRLLRELATDSRRLADLSSEKRRELLEAAGRLSRPDVADRRRLAKALRRKDHTRVRHHDARLVDGTRLRGLRHSPLYRAELPSGSDAEPTGPELGEPRNCYVCKADFTRLHFFYESLCPPCAALNWAKRGQTGRLDGRVALVTGARMKIGFQTALILLRAGARVLATTRCPHDAAARFAREPDFGSWRDELSIWGLDLRHVPSVELFADHLARTLPRLDILVNNAAQTVRRPAPFYAALLPAEERPLAPELAPLCAGWHSLAAELGPALPDANESVALVRWGRASGLASPAQLSQLPLTPEDRLALPFPAGALDADEQQIDLRPVNSWRLGAADVSTPELLEVHLVNAIAPFLLCARLRPLMAKDPTGERHVVNVSAMEAQFSRKKKTDKHPHTNMAKAALNMLTRTSAVDWAADRIWMNSVDTGWVTDEDPVPHVTRKQRVHDFYPPLDIVDGAARVLDPIFVGLASGRHPWGLFFKDYQPVPW